MAYPTVENVIENIKKAETINQIDAILTSVFGHLYFVDGVSYRENAAILRATENPIDSIKATIFDAAAKRFEELND